MLEHHPHAHSVVMSYLGVRRSLGLLAFLLPLALGPFGFFVLGIQIQDNMSSYYHTPLRDVFVGAMCAMGIFLFCYHAGTLDFDLKRVTSNAMVYTWRRDLPSLAVWS